ncbi:TonB C-terminal domain-containing protein [Paracoccus contaminans]|uniref:TonB C-terminal domain-containing protein n=1 Tax=Paracoccus contaminans TaxID=1945662 RepID=A0A1W6CY00_9RHOB|nr:TonB C-terminal domain-containing protein [Paracoccus contaminans]ARJ69659.1 hypothetical protein B0A89_08535 [Paracoccus contaminans]
MRAPARIALWGAVGAVVASAHVAAAAWAMRRPVEPLPAPPEAIEIELAAAPEPSRPQGLPADRAGDMAGAAAVLPPPPPAPSQAAAQPQSPPPSDALPAPDPAMPPISPLPPPDPAALAPPPPAPDFVPPPVVPLPPPDFAALAPPAPNPKPRPEPKAQPARAEKKAEAPRPEKPRAERPRQDKPRAEKPRPDRPRPDQPKGDQPKAEPARSVRTAKEGRAAAGAPAGQARPGAGAPSRGTARPAAEGAGRTAGAMQSWQASAGARITAHMRRTRLPGARGTFGVMLAVTVQPDGTTAARLVRGSGDARVDAALSRQAARLPRLPPPPDGRASTFNQPISIQMR